MWTSHEELEPTMATRTVMSSRFAPWYLNPSFLARTPNGESFSSTLGSDMGEGDGWREEEEEEAEGKWDSDRALAREQRASEIR